MNEGLIYSELMKGSLKELDRLKYSFEGIIFLKFNERFKKLFGSDENTNKLLEKCLFQPGTLLSMCLQVDYKSEPEMYSFELTYDTCEIQDKKAEELSKIWILNDDRVVCEVDLKPKPDLVDSLPKHIKDFGLYLWNKYKNYIDNQLYIEDEEPAESDEIWDDFIDKLKTITNKMY